MEVSVAPNGDGLSTLADELNGNVEERFLDVDYGKGLDVPVCIVPLKDKSEGRFFLDKSAPKQVVFESALHEEVDLRDGGALTILGRDLELTRQTEEEVMIFGENGSILVVKHQN